MKKKMKTGVNVINILRANFSYQCASSSFSLVIFWLCNFSLKNIGAKAASKMLLK
jgi:hypothetical protein